MKPIDDYRDALQLLTELMPDFVQSVLTAKVAPNTPDGKAYEQKAAYVLAMSDLIKSMNAARHNLLVSSKPRNDYRPNNNYTHSYSASPRPYSPRPYTPRRLDGDVD